MCYIQSGDEDTKGMWLMYFIGAMPVWTDNRGEAKAYDSSDDTALDEKTLELHHHLCWIIPA